MWALLLFIPLEPNNFKASDIAEKLEKYTEQFPIEKIFVHNDRGYYGPGETIWLKSYLVAGSLHSPSPISNNVHIELIAPDRSLSEHVMLYSESGFSNGHINVPNDAVSGTYLIRAYTNWMKNFDESFFFEKEIEIVADTTIQQTSPKPKTSIQFLPEGGHLVDQIPTRIAFKASHLISDELELFDGNDTSLGEIKIAHDGMGLFALSPQYGQTYYVKDGTGNRFDLPQIESSGYSISANSNLADLVKITLRANPNTSNKSNLKAIVHSRGLVSFAIDVDLSKNVAFLNLPKNQMPEGISHITLFDSKNNPILERLVFVDKDQLQANVQGDQDIYEPRSLVKTKVKVTDNEGNPVKGSFSLAALDVNLVPTSLPTKNIKTELLIDSDLKGKINNPSYYFSESPKAKEHLDLLLMTKGWRKFSWQNVIEENYPEIEFLIEKGYNVEGRHLLRG